MIYDNMEEWEVLNRVLGNNPAKKSVKQIAAYLGKSAQTIYKWGQDPDASGTSMPKEFIIPFCKFTSDVRLLEFYLYQLNYYAVPMAGHKTDGDIMDDIFKLDMHRGQLAAQILSFMRDHKMDKHELKALMNTVDSMRDNLETLLEELRLQYNE